MISFTSDNCSGIHPKILEKICSVNEGYQNPYGNDIYTEQLGHKLNEMFNSEVFSINCFNGTGGNVIAIAALVEPYEAVVCAEGAHIETDEKNAVFNFIGARVFVADSKDGKINLDSVDKIYKSNLDNIHKSPLKLISITQPTEQGSMYSLEELKKIRKFADERNLYVHMDGARIANSIASLNCSLEDIKSCVDILVFGGTKNGLLGGELLISFDKEIHNRVTCFQKLSSQLGSKARYVSAQFLAAFEDDLWLTMATHANETASYFAEQLKKSNIEILNKVDSNAIFAIVPEALCEKLQEQFLFYIWDNEKGIVRLMTSFDTKKEDIDKFVSSVVSYNTL